MQEQAKGQPAPPAAAQGASFRGFVQPPGIIFDSDMGRNIDAALALAMMYNLGTKARVIALGVPRADLNAAKFCDAIARFYSGDPRAQSTGAREILPVGLAEGGAALAPSSILAATLAAKNADGSPAFPTGVHSVVDTADVRVLFRNALSTQKEGEGIVVLAGPATNLAQAFTLNGTRDMASSRAHVLVLAAGGYPDGPADPRIKADIPAARRLLAQWPTPVVAVGMEVGAAVTYPAHSIESDFAWAAALFAANQKEDYFKLSQPGTIEVLADGRTRFSPSPSGKHRYLIADPAQKERVVRAIVELASAKPVAPAGRGFRRPTAQPEMPEAAPKPGGRGQSQL
jgi:hypothetical protein